MVLSKSCGKLKTSDMQGRPLARHAIGIAFEILGIRAIFCIVAKKFVATVDRALVKTCAVGCWIERGAL